MAKKKNATKEKMTKKIPAPEKLWADLCNQYEDAQKKVSAATGKAFVKGKLQRTNVAALNKTFDHLKKVKKQMKKFLKKLA